MTRRIVMIAALSIAGAVGAVAASAQDPLVPEGDYGGGTVAKVGKGPYNAGNMVISLHTNGAGDVFIDAWLGERCNILEIEDIAPLAPDGSFAATGVLKERDGRARLRTTYTITGTVGAAGATGTATAKTKITRPKHRARTCKTGTVPWAARRPTGVIGVPGSTPPAARLYGTTSQLMGQYNLNAGIVLRVSGDGTKLTRSIYSEYLDCDGSYSYGLDSPAISLPIAADGTISDVERIDRRIGRTRAISVGRFKGTLGSAGASGTLSIKVRYIDLRTKDVTRCNTGTVKWTASP